MTRARSVVTVVAAASLLAGVLWVRDGTAAVEADLADPAPSPAPVPGEPDDLADGLAVEANGVEGLRLGSTAPTAQGGPSTPDGCTITWPSQEHLDADAEADVLGWVLDGDVVSVSVASWEDLRSADARVTTWLGPTLGSPIRSAAELPGARRVVTRVSPEGPVVTVVTVPDRGVEVVYSDAPTWAGPDTPAAPGRVTTIEVRHPAGRQCVAAGSPQLGTGGGTTVVLDLDGLEGVRLGDDVDALVAAGELVEEGPAVGGCHAYRTVDETGSRVVSLGGRVATVETYGPGVRTSFGVQGGASLAELREAFGELDAPPPATGVGDVTWRVDDTAVRVSMWPDTVFVPDLDRPFRAGAAVVNAVMVSAPGVDATSVTC